MRLKARDFMGPKAKEKEIRELLDLPDNTLRSLGEDRGKLIDELEEFDSHGALMERFFQKSDHPRSFQ